MMFNPAEIIAEMEAIRKSAQKLDSQAARIIRMVSTDKPKRLTYKQRMKIEVDRSFDIKFGKV